jgi:hypothetical protein
MEAKVAHSFKVLSRTEHDGVVFEVGEKISFESAEGSAQTLLDAGVLGAFDKEPKDKKVEGASAASA